MMKIGLLIAVFSVSGMVAVAENESNTESTIIATNTTMPAEVSSPTSTSASQLTTKDPEQNCSDRWAVRDDDLRYYCIILQADIVVKITANNQSSFIRFDRNASHWGSCNQSTESITIADKGVMISWTITKNKNDASFNVTEIKLTFDKETGSSSSDKSWLNSIDSTKSYQCLANETVFKGTLKNNSIDFLITTSNLRLEAFQNSTKCDFNQNHNVCADDTSVSNLVPIIVGACLVGLIVIVLIAYLVGRRRSRRGYESV